MPVVAGDDRPLRAEEVPSVPQPQTAQLVLVELAAAAALGGYAEGGTWRIAGAVVAVLLVLLALVPVRRRWLFQFVSAGLGFLGRRRGGVGLAGVVGEHTVESVPGGGRGGALGVVRSGTTWCLPLVLGLDGVFNDDAPVPVPLLASLLEVEDVPLSSVRLVTLTSPAQPAAGAPSGPGPAPVPLAARYCLLTLDTRRAAETIAGRGGSTAAVQQILRLCASKAEAVLGGAGLAVRRLDATGAAGLLAAWLGPASPGGGRRGHETRESWTQVRAAGTTSTSFAVTGDGPDVPERVARLAAAAPAAVVVTSLLLRPAGPRGSYEATMLLRLSSPDAAAVADVGASLSLVATAYDLLVQPVDGDQGEGLRATLPLGVGEPV